MNVSKKVVFRSFFLALWAVFMTTLTIVLGAPPLRVLRLVMGRALFHVMVFGLCLVMFGLGLKSLSLLFLFIALLVSLYSEFLEFNLSPIWASMAAILFNSILGSFAFTLWTMRKGAGWFDFLLGELKTNLDQFPFLKGGVGLPLKDLLFQMPSLVIILMIVATAIMMIIEPRLREWSGKNSQWDSSFLKQFRLTDGFIWIIIAALLGSFTKIEIKWLQVFAANVLNICIVLYFFQGMAVFTSLFDRMKMTPFWRSLFSLILIFQLFILVAIVGLVDYWLDFRIRFQKPTKQFNKTL